MFRTSVLTASLVATVSVAASAMAGPIAPMPYRPGTPLPEPGFVPGLVMGCPVDPAVTSVTLTKGARRGEVRISYEVVNEGDAAWRSGARQQLVHLVAINNNTGRRFTTNQALTASAPAGAVMQRFTTPTIRNAFDDFEWGGSVQVAISYDPDIAIDGNRCNDDTNAGNNVVHIDYAEILDFMKGPEVSRTFHG